MTLCARFVLRGLAVIAVGGVAAPSPRPRRSASSCCRATPYTTFKSDAPLETVVGHTADTGLQGELTVDPAKPQAAKGTVKVDMNTVRTGIDKRDADMRGKPYLETDIEANRWVTFEVQSAELAGAARSRASRCRRRSARLLRPSQSKPVERVGRMAR